MLDLNQYKTAAEDWHCTAESNFLKDLCLKTGIEWGNSIDELKAKQDEKVSEKLQMCAILVDTLSFLQESIYTGHLPPKKINLAEQSQQTKLTI